VTPPSSREAEQRHPGCASGNSERGPATQPLRQVSIAVRVLPRGRRDRSEKGCRPSIASAPRAELLASADWSGASPTPSRAATSTRLSRSTPTKPGSRCRPSRSSTRDQAIAAFLPSPAGRAARRAAACRAHPRQHPAGLRLLPTGRTGSDRPPLRTDRADTRRRRDRGDHLVRRHRRLPILRAATDPAERLRLGALVVGRGPRLGWQTAGCWRTPRRVDSPRGPAHGRAGAAAERA
jgi:hypothetical protein